MTWRKPKTNKELIQEEIKDVSLELPQDMPTMSQEDAACTTNIFCCAALGDEVSGTFYTDITGAFPAVSLEGMHYYFIAYKYDTNTIISKPVTDLKDETILKAFEEVFNELTEKGYNRTSNVTNNQAARPIKAFLKTKKCKWQFVYPSKHRVNAAERAI